MHTLTNNTAKLLCLGYKTKDMYGKPISAHVRLVPGEAVELTNEIAEAALATKAARGWVECGDITHKKSASNRGRKKAVKAEEKPAEDSSSDEFVD